MLFVHPLRLQPGIFFHHRTYFFPPPLPSSLQVTQSIFNFRPLWFECVLCTFLKQRRSDQKTLACGASPGARKKRITSSFSAFEVLNAPPANYLFPLVNSQKVNVQQSVGGSLPEPILFPLLALPAAKKKKSLRKQFVLRKETVKEVASQKLKDNSCPATCFLLHFFWGGGLSFFF